MRARLAQWLRCLLRRRGKQPEEIQRAIEVVAAVDAGGVPLNPAKINRIARDLGLDVSTRAPVEETVERIRAAIKRVC